MLLDGALDKISIANGHMKRGEVAQKGAHISWAISIIEGLRTSLNIESGGELAGNLDRLYEYASQRLVEANLRNDPALLDEVQGLLAEVRAGWQDIQPPGSAMAFSKI
jgi:flagellar protein FliS